MIQPKSANQKRRSPGRQSNWNATSSAIFTRKPPCTWTEPFGRPVVPDVYAMKSGCSASKSRVSNGTLGAGHPVPGSSHHDHVLDGRARRGRGPRRGRHLDRRAAALRVCRRDERLRVGVLQTHRDRIGAVAGEDRQEDRAELGHRHARGDHLGDHRQEDADGVALTDTEARQGKASASVVPPQLAYVHVTLWPSSPSHTTASASGVAAAQRSTHALAMLSRPPTEPRRPRDAVGRVEHPILRRRERQAEELDDGAPEPLGVFDRAC